MITLERPLDQFERVTLNTLYALGEKVEHRHDHESRAVVRRLEKNGLYAHHSEDALERLLKLGLVAGDSLRVKALPLESALALGLEIPYLPQALLASPRSRPSLLAG